MNTHPSAAAVARVFGTTELLEAILLKLSTIDLAHLRTICRRWKAVTDGSTELDKRMFQRPIDNPEYIAWDTNRHLNNSERGYPVLQQNPNDNWQEGHQPVPILELHPFLKHDNDDMINEDTQWKLCFPCFLHSQCSASHFFDMAGDGKWRKQLVTQPPIDHLHVVVDYQEHERAMPLLSDNQETWNDHNSTLTRRDGVTLGDLQDLLFNLTIRHRRGAYIRTRVFTADGGLEYLWSDDERYPSGYLESEDEIRRYKPRITFSGGADQEQGIWAGSPWVVLARFDAERAAEAARLQQMIPVESPDDDSASRV